MEAIHLGIWIAPRKQDLTRIHVVASIYTTCVHSHKLYFLYTINIRTVRIPFNHVGGKKEKNATGIEQVKRQKTPNEREKKKKIAPPVPKIQQ